MEHLKNISITYEKEGQVAIVQLNRPQKYNALAFEHFAEIKQAFEYLGRPGSDVRAIVFSGKGKHFTAGLDLTAAMDMQKINEAGEDPARSAQQFFGVVAPLQQSVSSLEQVRVPVIAAVHGFAIGAGVDLASACDIRICSTNAKFSIKEVDIGLAADIGTLQRFQKVVGNESWARELAYTARFFDATEALARGFVSKVVDTPDQCLKEAVALACLIAEKSPVAVTTSKQSIVYSRDHSVAEGLNHVALLNSVMLQTDDLVKAGMAAMQKTKPVFAKL